MEPPKRVAVRPATPALLSGLPFRADPEAVG